jgi:hypothetical protein
MQKLSRREALRGTGVAALAAGAAVVPLGLSANPSAGGELAALLREYWRQSEIFEATNHLTDAEANADAARLWEETLRPLIGVPARTTEDALAAIDYILSVGEHSMIELGADDDRLFPRVEYSLLNAVRNYLAEESA